MDVREAYTTLELSYGASSDEVRRAYKMLSQVWHPDRFAHLPDLKARAQERMAQLNEAFECLKQQLQTSEAVNRGQGGSFTETECRFKTQDPRFHPTSEIENLLGDSRTCWVCTSPEGITVTHVRRNEAVQSVHYPCETIRGICSKGVVATLIARDPAGILEKPINVDLTFRNVYLAEVFSRRASACLGLVHPSARPPTPDIVPLLAQKKGGCALIAMTILIIILRHTL